MFKVSISLSINYWCILLSIRSIQLNFDECCILCFCLWYTNILITAINVASGHFFLTHRVSKKKLFNLKNLPNNKKEIYNDKYRHTRDRLFGLAIRVFRSIQLNLDECCILCFCLWYTNILITAINVASCHVT
jgi:hypothetical protein